ncbi:hypothetical protein [Pseudomonas monteilii]|uniref:hypothetical protein n=1 Tax=Pseudomonas monteilii TaxID=76759 RepID=UPI001E328E07|nr:hypothetical protein [Pseudomonas monteilii]MCE0931648.1 hypothetical protein [Pseudomonas monteilii]MCE1007478.1 hypothetical protein [Pseudomonas monteilii]WJN90194.1 hypothetical protein LU680_09895 [Pseudomonas monteilii]WJO34806.1 hypothetical protein LU690_08570 [Pseudomonas monteilii]WJR41151.1 hypothetical protein LU662_009145 [Pseudomonas monteilii]
MHHGLEGAKLAKRGYVANETRPERWENTGKCAHMAMAGKVQNAIASLPQDYQQFGHHLYAPVITTEVSNNWEEVALAKLAGHVHLDLERRGEKRTCRPYSREWWVARGVLVRYRHMVQGGMGANPDPMAAQWVFRAWLADNHGVELDSRNWARQWGWLVQLMFDQAGIIDGMCLRPVGRVLSEEREAA